MRKTRTRPGIFCWSRVRQESLSSLYLLSDESVYVRTDDEAAERDGVKNYIEIVENYFIDAYTETDCRYTIDVNSGLGPFVHYDVSDIVNDFFTEQQIFDGLRVYYSKVDPTKTEEDWKDFYYETADAMFTGTNQFLHMRLFYFVYIPNESRVMIIYSAPFDFFDDTIMEHEFERE